jgi:hypothetical protein
MKLVRQNNEAWLFHLNQGEAEIFSGLIQRFPFTGAGPIKISETNTDAKTIERERLLAESLAEHRNELKKLAIDLFGPDKWGKTESGQVLKLTSNSRELLLQLLNDIRLGCWHALGEPEPLEKPVTSKTQLVLHNLMQLAGCFEMSLLESEE